MPARRPRGEDTAGRLLTAALAVHAERGPGGFTMTAVVTESGISVGSLYHHFGSFDGLAAALYARCMGELLDALAAAVESADGPRDGVRALVTGYLRFAVERRAAAYFVHASSYAGFLPAHAEAIERAKAPGLGRILAWFRPHVEAGLVADLPEPLLEMLIIGPVAETTRRWLAGAPGTDPERAARLLPEHVWRSVRA